MIDLDGKVAIVTGAARGIGKAVASVLLDRGMKVAIWDKAYDDESLEEDKYDDRLVRFTCDITDEDAVMTKLNQTANSIGLPRYLVNSAGIIAAERLVGKEGPANLESFQKTINVNLGGTFNTLRLVANAMAECEPHTDDGERGVVVNLASVAAFEGQIGQVAYAASKGGVVGMTIPAARELSRYGIRVNTIAPGIVDTPMMGEVPEDIRDRLEKAIPFPKRYADPLEIGYLVAHIFENPMINGEVIRLDGGMRLPVL